MNKEQQDLAWACLPKEMRTWLRNHYRTILNHTLWQYSAYLRGRLRMMRDIIGEHNLTSDTEPEEMLMVERKKVQKLYYDFKTEKDRMHNQHENRMSLSGRVAMLQELFGDKCLPDEEAPVQVEPKFYIGQRVRAKGTKQIGTIKEPYSNDIGYRVYFEDGDGGWDKEYSADELEPYTEPETKDNSIQEQQEFQEQILCNSDRPTDEEIYRDLTGEIPLQEENDIKEKELNLCELLNLGDNIYNPTFSYGRVDLINTDIKPYFCVSFEDSVVSLSFLANGIEVNSKGKPSIWPNEELYEKYPLDAYSAWMEWKEVRTSKTPKTWSELVNSEYYTWNEVIGHLSTKEEPIYKSMFALLKIHQLIEAGYGGNVTDEEWKKEIDVYYVFYGVHNKFYVEYTNLYGNKRHIAFHTKEQAKEFLSYPENVQLLKDYYMI